MELLPRYTSCVAYFKLKTASQHIPKLPQHFESTWDALQIYITNNVFFKYAVFLNWELFLTCLSQRQDLQMNQINLAVVCDSHDSAPICTERIDIIS